jgi:phosphotriesterase-related protein
MVHEHLLMDYSKYFIEPIEASERKLAYEQARMENLSWVKRHSLSNLDNIKLTDEQLTIKEAMLYKAAGGDTIVDCTNSVTIGRDPLGLARIACATGLNIIMGTGYYLASSHPSHFAAKSDEEITGEMVRDIMVGVGNTGVHAGIIGEIGCSVPLEDSEKRVLRCSAVAQQQTGAAMLSISEMGHFLNRTLWHDQAALTSSLRPWL